MKDFIKNASQYILSPELSSFWVVFVLGATTIVSYIIFPKSLFLFLCGVFVFILTVFLLLKKSVNNELSKKQAKIQHESFVSVVENLEDAVIVYDKNFKIMMVNRAAEKFFSISKKEIEGTIINPSETKNPKLSLITQILFPSLAPGARQVSETNTWPNIVKLSFENPRLEITTTSNKITDKNDNLVAFIKIIKNKTHESSMITTKNEFIDVAAHQLRTPLTAIHWAMESIVKALENNPEMLDVAKEGLKASERSLKITNDLLDASKIEDGRFGYDFKETNIVALINTVVKEMSGIAKKYSVELFNTSVESSIIATIDENSIGMVLFNLVDNAIRYNTKNGKVFVSAQKTADNKNIKVVIKDTGVGIPEDEVSKIFEKLHRGSNVIQIEPNGTGLGLYIAKNIIKRHGGDIGVESTVRRGSSFWFVLPIQQKNYGNIGN